MQTRKRFLGSDGVFGGVLLVGLVAIWSLAVSAQGDPFLGRWVLNAAKSKYSPGPPPRSVTVTYAATDQGVKVTVRGVDAKGTPTSWEYTGGFDGKDFPVTGSPAFDTMSLKRVDANTVEFTRKKDGKVVQTGTNVIAKDGMTRTITTKGVDEKGEKFHNVAVFEKQ